MSFKVIIDASMYSLEVASLGVVSGELELISVPEAGDFLSFKYPALQNISCPTYCLDFNFRINKVVHYPNGNESSIVLYLDDIIFESTKQGVEVGYYLEAGFNLVFDLHFDPDFLNL